MKKIILILLIFVFIILRAMAEDDACFSSTNKIISKRIDWEFKSVKSNELEIVNMIDRGTSVNVYEVKYREKKFVYRQLTVASENGSNILELLGTEEKKELKRMDLGEAKFWVKYYQKLYNESFDRNFTVLERYQSELAKMIFNFAYMKKIEPLRYKDRGIIPQMFSLVKNKEGIVVGQLIEYLPGKNLTHFMHTPGLTYKKLDLVLRQLTELIKLLGKNHFYHGDLVPKNVMVRTLENGEFEVKLIDFDPLVENSQYAKTQFEKDLLKIDGFIRDFAMISIGQLKY